MSFKVTTLAAILFLPGLWQQAPSSEKAVTVTLTEWKIEMPRTLPAGAYNLKITNSGKHAHTLKIKSAAFEVKLARNLNPGESAELKIDLKPGVYEVYCPIGFSPLDHSHRGMELQLTVQR